LNITRSDPVRSADQAEGWSLHTNLPAAARHPLRWWDAAVSMAIQAVPASPETRRGHAYPNSRSSDRLLRRPIGPCTRTPRRYRVSASLFVSEDLVTSYRWDRCRRSAFRTGSRLYEVQATGARPAVGHDFPAECNSRYDAHRGCDATDRNEPRLTLHEAGSLRHK